MTPQTILAESVAATKQLTARYLAGFTDDDRTRQAENLPNHVAWNLGHLALTMHRIAEKIDGKPIPASDIGPAGTASVYANEAVAFGSKPAGDTAAYPPLARCIEIYNNACDRLAGAVRAAPDAKLTEVVKWGAFEFPLHAMVSRMVFHNGFHTGQIADLRPAFGFKSIFS